MFGRLLQHWIISEILRNMDRVSFVSSIRNVSRMSVLPWDLWRLGPVMYLCESGLVIVIEGRDKYLGACLWDLSQWCTVWTWFSNRVSESRKSKRVFMRQVDIFGGTNIEISWTQQDAKTSIAVVCTPTIQPREILFERYNFVEVSPYSITV